MVQSDSVVQTLAVHTDYKSVDLTPTRGHFQLQCESSIFHNTSSGEIKTTSFKTFNNV